MYGVGQIAAIQGGEAARRNGAEVRRCVDDTPGRDGRRGGGDGDGLIDADVVHEHVLREGDGGVGRAEEGGGAADGEIQQKEEWRVENPLVPAGSVAGVTV